MVDIVPVPREGEVETKDMSIDGRASENNRGRINPPLDKTKIDSPFPFDRLCGELRNKIYEFVLEKSGPKILSVPGERRRARIFTYRKGQKPKPNQTAILRVSRQIYSETSTLLYALREFEFQNVKTCRAFLRCIGWRNRRHIRRIKISAPSRTRSNEARDMFALLSDSEKLQRVTFYGKSFLSAQKALGADDGSSILPFLKSMVLRTRDTVKVLDILQFEYWPSSNIVDAVRGEQEFKDLMIQHVDV